MKIEKLSLKNFKNIEFLEIFPDEKMNVICGENAQGKTNIIESLWLFSGAKSFKGTKDSDFIKFSKKNSQIECDFEFSKVKNNAKILFSQKKEAYFNDKKLPSVSNLAGNFNAIVFSPTDLSLIKDGPAARRKFLDTAIGGIYPNYIEILRNYLRAVTQRNEIIKNYKYDTSLCVLLDVFEKEIADSGRKIIKYRKEYLKLLFKYIPEIYFGLSNGKEKIMSVYVANSCDNIEEQLKESRNKDSYLGATSVGPHRDDIKFTLNDVDLRNFGSQGQQRSVALALKFATSGVIKEISGEYPICLLDDVMSELDVSRQNYILNHIEGWQSFITCCDPSNVKNLNKGKIINIKNGSVI